MFQISYLQVGFVGGMSAGVIMCVVGAPWNLVLAPVLFSVLAYVLHEWLTRE